MTALPKLKLPAAQRELANGEPRSQPRSAEQRLALYNIDWRTYQALGEAQKYQRFFLSYDRGALEIMVLGNLHEWYKDRFAYLITALAEGLDRQIESYGSSTHQREDLQRGVEPDQCFYVANFKRVHGPREIDLTRDPPPDLVLEIEISRSLVSRLGILEALGVPEVWRFDGQTLTVLLLRKGKYQESVRSLAFPEVPVARLPEFLPIGQNEGIAAMARAVRQWARGLKTGKKKRK